MAGNPSPIVWPQDMSGFVWQNGGLSALFDRKLLVVQLDRPDRNLDDLLGDADKIAAQTPLSECPPQKEPDHVDIKFPKPGEEPSKPQNWTGQRTLTQRGRCIEVNDRHWVAPRTIDVASKYFFGDTFGAGATQQALRFSRKLTTIKLPTSRLTCSSDVNLREYRLRFRPRDDPQQPSPIPADNDLRRPKAYGKCDQPGARCPIAKGRFAVSVVQDGHRDPVRTQAFVVQGRAHPAPSR